MQLRYRAVLHKHVVNALAQHRDVRRMTGHPLGHGSTQSTNGGSVFHGHHGTIVLSYFTQDFLVNGFR